jgi:hypothetical protein
MRVAVDGRFRLESEAYAFRFTCRDCLLFIPEKEACAHEWPNGEHRDPPAAEADTVLFCKEFELR